MIPNENNIKLEKVKELKRILKTLQERPCAAVISTIEEARSEERQKIRKFIRKQIKDLTPQDPTAKLKNFRPYNITFDSWESSPFTEKQAEKFVIEHNKYKGGVWVVRKESEYQEWLKIKEQDPQFVKDRAECRERLKQYIQPMQRRTYPSFLDILVYQPYLPINKENKEKNNEN